MHNQAQIHNLRYFSPQEVYYMPKFIAIGFILLVGVIIAGIYLLRSPETKTETVAVTSGNCSEADLMNTQQSISNQTQSLSDKDFGKAMSYSSDSFRSRVSESDFTNIITLDYSFLLNNPQITFNSCNLSSEGVIEISASFDTGTEVAQLTYSMVNEKDGWFIDVASKSGNEQLAV